MTTQPKSEQRLPKYTHSKLWQISIEQYIAYQIVDSSGYFSITQPPSTLFLKLFTRPPHTGNAAGVTIVLPFNETKTVCREQIICTWQGFTNYRIVEDRYYCQCHYNCLAVGGVFSCFIFTKQKKSTTKILGQWNIMEYI